MFRTVLHRLDHIRHLLTEMRAQHDTDARLADRLGRLEQAMSELTAASHAQRAVIGHLRTAMETHGETMPSWPWPPEVAERVRAVLRRLQPWQVEGVDKLRLGRAHDGGYVMLDDFADVRAAISCGIRDDVSWDLEMAARGIAVYQFDNSIANVPQPHALFHFHRTRIDAHDGEGTISLSNLLRQLQAAGQGDIILKIDIEGSEWDAFNAVDPDLLATCRQVACEFHFLERLAETAFAQAASACFDRFIAAGFCVAHVHGNNCGNLINVGNVTFPETLEVLFVNRRRYHNVSDALTLFPTRFDMPNQADRADLFLGTFRF